MAGREVVLVTGASGFLAAWILQSLSRAGHSIVATDLTCDRSRLDLVSLGRSELPGVSWVACDITDGAALEALVRETKPNVILHLAALQIPACRANPALGAQVNVVGHVRVLEVARQVGARVVYTSSVAAKPRGPENAPANLYGVFKRASEEISRLYASDFGVASLGLRPHVVYGVGRDQGETSAVTAAMRAAALGERFVVPWRTATCFQYAGDIAEVFTRCCTSGWEGAVVSDISDVVETTEDILVAIKAAEPSAPVTVEGPERISPVEGFALEPLRKIIGPLPRISLVDGVQATIERFRALRQSGLI